MPDYSYRPEPRITELGEGFFDVAAAAEFPSHQLRFRNRRHAGRVGLGDLTDAQWLDHFGRFEPLPGNLAEPLALRYHGHQFRSYNPELGDGRGFLFAQLRDGADDRLLDLGTKGSGRTPWSRQGDGRLTLKGGVREVLATELLEALGVYTSKSFSLVETGEALFRGDEPSPTRSSVLVRLGHSHIRFGSFQRHAYRRDAARVQELLDYSVRTYMPDLAGLDGEEKVAAFLGQVCRNTARLAADWHVAGFVHGVLNTDNMNITGESFDYGPYRFLPTFQRDFTAAYFDTGGLYAFGRQPATLGWNLARLAETFLSLAGEKTLVDALAVFEPSLQESLEQSFLRRMNLRARPGQDVGPLLEASYGLLDEMAGAPGQAIAEGALGYERFFFDWYGGRASAARRARSPHAELWASERARPLAGLIETFEPDDPARLDHPYFQGSEPCTLLIAEIESIWEAIAENDDWGALEGKLEEISMMREALATS
jgi:uncharacterized protein YdiU (UPF0061 family)